MAFSINSTIVTSGILPSVLEALIPASAEIWCHNKLYPSAMRWISLQPAFKQASRVVAGTRANWSTPWDEEDGKHDDQENISEDNQLFRHSPREFWFKKRCRHYLGTLRYTPSQDHIHLFRYKDTWVAFHRQPYKETGSPWFANMERLYFYVVPWKRCVLDDLMNEIRETPVNGDPKQVAVYGGFRMGSSFQWMQVASKRPRYLSTVALDHDNKRRVVEDVEEFLNPKTRTWYQSRGFPYRRGYILDGPPGTGKSSLCLAIASMAYLDIYMVSLGATGLDENSLATLFRNLPKDCIVLLEDIDEAGIQKRSSDSCPTHDVVDVSGEPSYDGADGIPQQSGRLTLSACLNVIDGVAAQEDRILIMTTNRLSGLDGALLRPGRVDMKIHMGLVHRLEAREIFLMFYLRPTDNLFMEITSSSVPANPDWELEEIDSLSTAFADTIPSGQFTAAGLQEYLLQYKHNPSAAARDVKNWLFDLDFETDLSTFRITESPHQFRFHGTVYNIRVNGHTFLWPDDDSNGTTDLPKPRLLLIQRALCDTESGCWEVPGGCVDQQDQNLQNALEREVQKMTGLQLSQVAHDLPIQTWNQLRGDGCHQWVNFSCIFEVSKPHTINQGVPRLAINWEDAVLLNPKEHQAYVWATEDEVQCGKYQTFGNNRETMLKAFAKVTRNRSV